VQNKTRLPHRFGFFKMVSVSAGYKHREIAIGTKKKNKLTNSIHNKESQRKI
jgi:hypothetical protein